MSYAPEVWRAARRHYEADGWDRSRIVTEYGMSYEAVDKKIAGEKWVKNSMQAMNLDVIREQIIQGIIDQGIIEEIPKKLRAMMDATDAVMGPDGKILCDEHGKPLISRSDWTAIRGAIQEGLKIVGAYAPQKSEIDIKIKLTEITAIYKQVIVEFVQTDKINACVEALQQKLNNGRF